MDISNTLAPTSDQLDAIDLATSGPQTFTITKVTKGSAEQPVQVTLAEFPRVWRPGKSMRRVMASMWGTDASVWVGKRVTLYCDPDVKYGGVAVGGTRISHASGIGKPHKALLMLSRGKTTTVTIQPLPDTPAPPPEPTEADVSACDDVAVLRGWWQQSGDERRAQIQSRVAELQSQPADDEPGAPWPAQDALPTEGGE